MGLGLALLSVILTLLRVFLLVSGRVISFPVSEIGLKNGRMENTRRVGFSRNLKLNFFAFFSAEIEPGIERVRMLKQTMIAVALKMFFFMLVSFLRIGALRKGGYKEGVQGSNI